MKTLVQVLLLAFVTGLSGWFTWQYAAGPYAVLFGMVFAVSLFWAFAWALAERNTPAPKPILEHPHPALVRGFQHQKGRVS